MGKRKGSDTHGLYGAGRPAPPGTALILPAVQYGWDLGIYGRKGEREGDTMGDGPDTRRPSIEQVRDQYERQFLDIEGVEGIGIGIDERSGATAIKVYVAQKTRALQEQLPTQVDGYPVQIEATGEEFHILPA